MAIEPAAAAGKPSWTGYVEPEHGVKLPCTVIRGRGPGPKLLVTAGVHGAEYASIEAARRLTQLASDAFVGELTILPIINVGAFFQHRAFRNPSDEKNINRVFPGDPKGSASDRLAPWLVTESEGHPSELHSPDHLQFPHSLEQKQAIPLPHPLAPP